MPFDGRTPPAWPPCTPDEVTRIATITCPIQRNFEITQSYHRITLAVGRRLGHRDLPWTGYAVWASRMAGRFIRGDWMPGQLRRRAVSSTGRAGRAFERVDAQVRAHVAEGNRLVYAEIAPLFVELIGILDAAPDERFARLRAVTATLAPGPVQRGGQEALARALGAYVMAHGCENDARRAQWILLGNLLVGYHEQWRLQAEIRGALDATWHALPTTEGVLGRTLRRRAAARMRRLGTRLLMRLETPGEALRMATDVPPLADGRMFPAGLERIELAALRALLSTIDRTPDTTEGSAADDWADFGDRMNYVADMFRSRQRDEDLWLPPFRPSQVLAIQRGERPVGRM